jgi:hypothetical protein
MEAKNPRVDILGGLLVLLALRVLVLPSWPVVVALLVCAGVFSWWRTLEHKTRRQEIAFEDLQAAHEADRETLAALKAALEKLEARVQTIDNRTRTPGSR